MNVKYKTSVVEVGNSIKEIGDDIIILFGSNVTDDLKDYCYVINTNSVEGKIKVGDYIEFDGEEFEILGLGDMAQKNLESLGHLSIYTNGNLDELLPGAIVVDLSKSVNIKKGTIIKIIGE